jgi:hypothetical protein
MAKSFTAHRPKSATGGTNSATGNTAKPVAPAQDAPAPAARPQTADRPKEVGGPSGPEPTRYGDWERKGICVDF